MKTLSKPLLILALLIISNTSFANETENLQDVQAKDEFVNANNTSFKPGEKLTYRLSYGLLDAGEAILTVDKTTKKVRGRELWKVRGTGRTISAFEWFYKVNDVYETFVEKESVQPRKFLRDVHEGGFKLDHEYNFDVLLVTFIFSVMQNPSLNEGLT